MGFHNAADALTFNDPHDDGARFGHAEGGDHRYTNASEVESHGHCENVGVLVGVDRWRTEHLQLGERVGVEPPAVPRVEPVGDDVARLARSFQTGDRSELRAAGPRRQHRGVQRRFAADLIQP